MFTVYITRKIPEAGIKKLKATKGLVVKMNPDDRVLAPEELKRAVKGADAILSLLTDKIDSSVLDAAGKQLKIVANYAVGFDNVDLKAAAARKVFVTNAPGPLITESVAEHTIALMLALAHRIAESDRFARAGKYKGWEPMLLLGTLLAGKTFGIIGTGRIGGAAAKKAKGIGMNVIYADPNRQVELEKETGAKQRTMEQLLGEADVVSLHVPLLPSTKYLMDTEQFALMKRTAFLINTARGPVVREKSLLRALKTNRVAGAALDVFECEPALDCDLSDHLELTKLDNVILTPHTASATIEARQEMSLTAAANILAVFASKTPQNLAK
jgi:lactate dehydrogenase-like 2-hydroxyacid dehydrogenase